MNNLLKQGVTSLMSLRESREHFNHVLANHEENCALRHHRRLFPVSQDGYMPLFLYRELSAKMAKKLAKQTKTAESIAIEEIEDLKEEMEGTPAVFVFDKGEYVTFLNSHKKKHTEAFKTASAFGEWFTKYVTLKIAFILFSTQFIYCSFLYNKSYIGNAVIFIVYQL